MIRAIRGTSVKPVVTIGICVKNEEANIERALECVLEQDFPHELMEVIVVDGHSNDRTVDIVEETLSKRDIEYTILFESKGLGYARQMVVETAKGDYIIWVDGDIRLAKDYTKKQVEFMERNPKVGIAGGKYKISTNAKMVSLLENIAYVIQSFMYGGKQLPDAKLWGTEGSTFRVKAVKQVGGFDSQIKGAAEDTDIAYRIRAEGWSIYATDAQFYEECRESWKAIWDQYFWYGYGLHYVHHKDVNAFILYKMTPPAGFLEGILCSVLAYKLTRRKMYFLLPFQYFFKRTAWCLGFLKSHTDGYGHIPPPHLKDAR